MMKQKKRSPASPIAFTLVLMLLLSLFSPVYGVEFPKDVSNYITDKTVTLSQGGKTLDLDDANLKIDSEQDLKVGISFGVPVVSDPTEGGAYVVRNDTAIFEVSEHFQLMSGSGPMVLKSADGTPVGTLTLTTGSGSKVIANVVFDGDPTVFDGSDPSLNSVTCFFNATLRYDKTGDDGEAKDVTVQILEREFTVSVPDAPIEYTVSKSGTADLSARQVAWTVTVEAEKAGNSVDLKDYKFVDNLSGVGAYVPGTFAVDGTLTDAAVYANNVLNYTFPEGSGSPKTITFATVIPEGKYYGSG
jgi:hypothetical protein